MATIIKRKIYYIVLALFTTYGVVDAQYKKELSAHIGGGLSSLQYGVSSGTHRPGFGAHSGICYRYFFTKSFGFVTGFEFAYYNAVFKSDQFNLNQWSNDGAHTYEFRSTGNVKEKQYAVMMQIPLKFQLQNYNVDKKFNPYGAIGIKLGVPLFGTYKINANYSNSGYYPFEDYTYTDQRFRGFGKYSEQLDRGSLELNPIIAIPLPSNEDGSSSSIDFPLAALMSLEVGLKWKVWKRKQNQITNTLYTGLYLDYGLNSLRNIENERYDNMIETNYVNNHFNLKANSIFPADVLPVSAGVRIHFVHGYGTFTERTVKSKKIVLKKRTVTIKNKCDCCRICFFPKKPNYRCAEKNRTVKHTFRYRKI